MGDLNYRIDLPDQEIRQLIKSKHYYRLLKYDQLENQRKAGLAFAGFDEAAIDFSPTYKFVVGTNEYYSNAEKVVWNHFLPLF
jgi:hypothetical protein